MQSVYRRTVWGALALVLGACGSGGYQGPRVPASQSPGPSLTVERFLRAANANDLQTMSQLFGTAKQTIVELDGRARAEQRMYVLASLLRHDDWRITGQDLVPGRTMDATDMQVELKKGDDAVVVPFLVVRRDDGGWAIERIDVEKLTTGGR